MFTLMIRLFLLSGLILFAESGQAGQTIIESGNVFSSDNGKLKELGNSYESQSDWKKITILESYIFLQHGLRVFCSPFHNQIVDEKICIKHYENLLLWIDQGLETKSLDGIYFADASEVPMNLRLRHEPLTDIFGFSWLDGRSDVTKAEIQKLIVARMDNLKALQESMNFNSRSIGKQIQLRCFSSQVNCLAIYQEIGKLTSSSVDRLLRSPDISGINVVDSENTNSFGFDGVFSKRVIQIQGSLRGPQVESFIRHILNF